MKTIITESEPPKGSPSATLSLSGWSRSAVIPLVTVELNHAVCSEATSLEQDSAVFGAILRAKKSCVRPRSRALGFCC